MASERRILLVEDEPHLAFNLELNLKEEGYSVTLVNNGAAAIDSYSGQGPFDLIILDVMLPEKNGFEVAKFIRARDIRTGILMLTARASDQDRLKGLEIGVDDYITKPFHLGELLLKVKRALKRVEMFREMDRNAEAPSEMIACGPYELDIESLRFKTPEGTQSVTALEADVLSEFLQNPGRVLSRDHLLKKVWGMNGNMETRTVDNFVMRIRRYIESNPAQPAILESVRGRGYRWNKVGE